MGTGILVKCQKCSYQRSFDLGVGMMYYDLGNVLDNIKEARVRANIKEILKTHPYVNEDFENAVYACPKCHTLHGRLYVKLSEGNNLLYQTEYYCSRCDIALKQLPEKAITKQPCPGCGEKALSVSEELLWD